MPRVLLGPQDRIKWIAVSRITFFLVTLCILKEQAICKMELDCVALGSYCVPSDSNEGQELTKHL